MVTQSKNQLSRLLHKNDRVQLEMISPPLYAYRGSGQLNKIVDVLAKVVRDF